MNELFILSSCSLKQQDRTILYQAGKIKQIFPVEDLKDIYIFSDLDLNSRFIRFISSYNIHLHYFGFYGNYLGCYKPNNSQRSGDVLVKQIKCFDNKRKRLLLAKQIVKASAANIMSNLSYYQNRKKVNFSILFSIISKALQSLEHAQDINQVMGCEGIIKRAYFTAFTAILTNDFGFSKRIFRPPADPVNALLSFGNALLYSICMTELLKSKLEPSVAILHSTNHRHNSLALDVADLFKPLISDRLLFTCINKKILSKKDFVWNEIGCFLNDSGKKIYIQKFQEKISRTFYHRTMKRRVSYRYLVCDECRKIRQYILKKLEYKPFITWW